MSKEPKLNRSKFRRLVNLIGLEKRDTIIGSKVEMSVKKAIRCVLKPRQTASEWIRETIIKELEREAEETG